MEVWESEENLENEKEKRAENKEKLKYKKFGKRIEGKFNLHCPVFDNI